MSKLVWISGGRGASERGVKNLNPMLFRFVPIWGCSLVVLAVGCSKTEPEQPRAGTAASSGPVPTAGANPPAVSFIAESRESLGRLHERMTSLADRVLAGLDVSDPPEANVASQSLVVESAQAAYRQAILAREAGEIAVHEYQDAVYPQERKNGETDVDQAQAELETAERAIAPAKERYAKIKQASAGSAADLAAEWSSEAGLVSAQLSQKKAMFALEHAQSKLKVLIEYEHGKRVRDLKAAVEKAHANELATRAAWEREQSKLKRMQGPRGIRRPLSDERKRILSLLDQAIPIEEKLIARLDPLSDVDPPGESVRTEITGLIRQLREIVDKAQREQTAAALERLRSGLRGAPSE